MNKKKYFKRIEGLFRLEKLIRKKGMIVGLGAGGGRGAIELARFGIELILIERIREYLREHNILRHILGYSSLGKLKLSEVAKHIRNYNPSVAITQVELDVTHQTDKFRKFVERVRPDFILVCTDNEESKHAIDGVATVLGIPQIGAGVYDGGVGGEVYIVRPKMACYGCIAEYLHLKKQPIKKGVNINYNNLPEARSTCALNLDIEQIAILQARVALNLLLEGEPDLLGIPPEVNLVVFANRVVPGVFARPLHAEFYSIPKQPGCLVCGATPKDADEQAKRILASLDGPQKRLQN